MIFCCKGLSHNVSGSTNQIPKFNFVSPHPELVNYEFPKLNFTYDFVVVVIGVVVVVVVAAAAAAAAVVVL